MRSSSETGALFRLLRQSATAKAADAIEALVADGRMPAVAQAFGLDRFGGPAARRREPAYAETGTFR